MRGVILNSATILITVLSLLIPTLVSAQADKSFANDYPTAETTRGWEKNWVKTVPGKGWFSLIRLYGPDQSFFDREWKPGDFEKMN